MVTQEGTTITIPAHELAAQGTHSVTMVTADGSDEQVGVAGTSVSGLFIWEETHQSFSYHSERDCWRTAHAELVNKLLQGKAVNDQSISDYFTALLLCMRSDYVRQSFCDLRISVKLCVKLPKKLVLLKKSQLS